MELLFNPKELEGVARGRESYSGRPRTNNEYFEIVVMGGICENEIEHSGTYGKVRNACCLMLSSAGRMTYMQAEDAINNIFKERTGMSMHVKAEGMKARLKELSPEQRREIGEKVSEIEPMMREGKLLNFNRVLSEVSSQPAKELNVPELGITNIMREEFNRTNPDKEFYDWGKELNKEIYQPQVEELKKEIAAERSQAQGRTRSPAPSR